jgi:hypothetical protein
VPYGTDICLPAKGMKSGPHWFAETVKAGVAGEAKRSAKALELEALKAKAITKPEIRRVIMKMKPHYNFLNHTEAH